MKKGDFIKFKAGIGYLYGRIDTVREGCCTVTYGTKKDFDKALKHGLDLAPLIDVNNEDLILIEVEDDQS